MAAILSRSTTRAAGFWPQLADHHAGNTPLQGLEVFLVLSVGAAIFERQHRDTRPCVLRDKRGSKGQGDQ